MKATLLALCISLAPSLAWAAEELPPPPPPPPGANEPPAAEPTHQAPSDAGLPDNPILPPPARSDGAQPARGAPVEAPLSSAPPPAPAGVTRVPEVPSSSESAPQRRHGRRRFDDRPWALSAELGLASVVGCGGAVGGYNVHDRVLLEAGLGVTGGGGPALAINGHVRPFLWFSGRRQELQAITVDVGYSFSRYETSLTGQSVFEKPSGPAYHLDWAHWFQYAFGWELLSEGGYDFRAAFGVAIPTNTGDVYCTNATGRIPCPNRMNSLPSLSFSVGRVF